MAVSVGKFFNGFNIFNPEKLCKIFYVMLIASLCLGIYHFITRATYETTNKTTITKPQEVYVDNRSIIEQKDKEKAFLGLRIFGLKLGLSYSSKQAEKKANDTKTVNNPL